MNSYEVSYKGKTIALDAVSAVAAAAACMDDLQAEHLYKMDVILAPKQPAP